MLFFGSIRAAYKRCRERSSPTRRSHAEVHAITTSGSPRWSCVDRPLVVVGGESIQLAMKVEAIPEEGLVEILAPKGSDEPLDERMRARHKGDRFEFLDVENSQIRSPAMKPE
jgi:hypothetical protein